MREGVREGAQTRANVCPHPRPSTHQSPHPCPLTLYTLYSPPTRKQPSYEGFVIVRRLPAASPLKRRVFDLDDENEEAWGDEAGREEEETAPVIMWKSPAQGTVAPCCTVTV